MKTIHLSVEDALYEELQKEAKRDKRSIRSFVILILENHSKQMLSKTKED